MLRAGTSVVSITPPLGTPLAGFFEYREAETVDDELNARVLVLDDGATRIALVVCDLIVISAATVAAIRARIEERGGIPGSHVMISCTHTHTGPATVAVLSYDADPAYLAWLVDQIADGVAVACSRLVPARVAHGAADVAGVCFNRRFQMRDGTVVFNPGIGNPDIVGPVGPVDPQVSSLLIEDAAGTPVALWANLSLHYVGTDNPLAVSADYYGHFASAVKRWLGEDCVGLLTNGTSGNINNVDVHHAVTVSGTSRARLVAMAVAAAAVQATLMQRRDDHVTLMATRLPFTVQRRPIMAEDVTLAEAILAGATDARDATARQTAPFSFVVGQPIPEWQHRAYAHEVLHVAQMPATATTEVQLISLGEVALVGLPGEIFVEFGLQIKDQSPFPRTVVVSLANDHIGYVPTDEAFRQGGYETWTTRSAHSAAGTGEAMTAAVLEQLSELRAGALPPMS